MVDKIKRFKSWYSWHKLFHNCWRSTENEKIEKMDQPIDFVVLWVDDQDPEWRAEKERYERAIGIFKDHKDNGEERYRDWGLFRYWFRAVEQYAPWVRNVYLVTCGHYPEWLNKEAPKLKLVTHSDFISSEYLPTFSCNPLEMNLHRIPGIGEHFVYFNDDVFLCRPTVPEDFFRGGLPNCTAIARPLNNESNGAFDHMLFTAYGAINNYFRGDVTYRILKNPEKWLSAQYGEDVEYNIRAVKMGYIPGMHFTHLALPVRKQTYKKIWEAFPDLLRETTTHKFRTPQDVQNILLTMWEIMEGSFNAVAPEHHGRHFWKPMAQLNEIREGFFNNKYLSVCINDSETVTTEEFHVLKTELKKIMEETFPEKSSFEK